MLGKFLIAIFIGASLAFATKSDYILRRSKGMCCDWRYHLDSIPKDQEPYDDIILHSGSARSMEQFFGCSGKLFCYQQICMGDVMLDTYDNYLRYNPSVEGTIVIKFTINHKGSIVNDTILSSTTKDKKFDEVIRKALHSTAVKAKDKKRYYIGGEGYPSDICVGWEEMDSGTTTVTFPFTFWKSKENYYRSKRQQKIQKPLLNPGDESYNVYWRKRVERSLNREKSVTLDTNSVTLKAVGNNSRSKQEILGVFNVRKPGVTNVYYKYLKSKPNFNGKIKIKFTITSNGGTNDVSIASSTTNYPEFDNAVKDFVASFIWKAREGTSTTCTISLIFTAPPPPVRK